MSYWVIGLLLVLLVNDSVMGHGSHETGQNPLHDTKRTHDKDHIQEHLKDEIDVTKEQGMSDEDLQFHYFKLHDYNHDNKLDGIELMNAMTHYHDEEAGDQKVTYTDEQMSGMIDQILQEDDLNHDGYIDYPEFVASQKAGAE